VAKAKKKILPKDFEALLERGDLKKLKEVFASCNVDARGGYAKQTALAFDRCPDELARWLVAEGQPLEAEASPGRSGEHEARPVPRRSGRRRPRNRPRAGALPRVRRRGGRR